MQLGKKQLLTVVKIVDFGIYLADPDDPEDRVLLPKKQVRAGVRPGDQMEVFLYKASRDRPSLRRRSRCSHWGMWDG